MRWCGRCPARCSPRSPPRAASEPPWWAARRPDPDDPRRSLAHRRDVAAHTGDAARRGAQRLRPSLRGVPARKLAEAEIGIVIGRLLRPAVTLFSSWEDTIVALMAPRSGKTTAVAVPAVLSAPGPVVATSNRADVWAATAKLRAERTGERVWVFDPQSIAYAPQTWWWDPLRGLDTVEEAERLASHFVLTVDDERSKRDIWGPAAQELLTSLFLAAKLTGGTVLDVYEWLSDESTPRPVQALRDSGHAALAASLVGMQGSPPETRGSVYFTARTAAKCLRNPQITAWVTHPFPTRTPPREGADRVRPGDVPDHAADAVPAVQGQRRVGGAAGRRAHRPGDARRRAARGAPRRATGPTRGGRPRRGGEHLPHRRPARAVLPSRLARGDPDHHPAVPRPRRRRVGAERHQGPARRRHREDHRPGHGRGRVRRGPRQARRRPRRRHGQHQRLRRPLHPPPRPAAAHPPRRRHPGAAQGAGAGAAHRHQTGAGAHPALVPRPGREAIAAAAAAAEQQITANARAGIPTGVLP